MDMASEDGWTPLFHALWVWWSRSPTFEEAVCSGVKPMYMEATVRQLLVAGAAVDKATVRECFGVAAGTTTMSFIESNGDAVIMAMLRNLHQEATVEATGHDG